ncbi:MULTISPECIES: hypothetical protein [unclassified Mycobacterium]|uniref:hypothetical protein n=1 Tax=unclassified Mycobacterium TaxID=2642494 RepID=UPI00074016A4|nr:MULTISPECIES: hypothetical protein [unclassified Mycobacterium]KUH88143.1 hypothetical protein AU186_09525 [Mycobacterium sp. GA-1999]KUH89451.1 hypothetical protein AU185_14325 [Mycobacterium sp. GA-0227b]
MTIRINVDWDTIDRRSQTTLTTHLWTAPPLRRGSPIHVKAFQALRNLEADLARFLPWFAHPRVSVPELVAPTETETSWNFELLDPFVADFMDAAQGRPVVMNFATIPAWMFTTDIADLPEDPNEIVWHYESCAELRDPTCAEVADYFYRIASWYIAGGFTDELGHWHESGHHYRFAYWEVLCEPDIRGMSPQTYAKLFDAVVTRLRPLDPEMKFVGLSLTHMHRDPEYFWQFLDPANHNAGAAPDAMSYHLYAHPEIVNPYSREGNPPFAHWRDAFFAQADGFIEQARFIESIRTRIAPDTKTFVNEIGTFTAEPMDPAPDIPDEYWDLSAAVQSYLWVQLVRLGVDLVGVAEFIGYPGMIPGVTLIDWATGLPNARYHALELLMRHFGPGDSVVSTSTGQPAMPDPRVCAQGFVSTDGTRKLLLINKTAAPVVVSLPAGPCSLRLDGYAVVVRTF